MSKTKEEIIESLGICGNDSLSCNGCSYEDEYDCKNTLMNDAKDLIIDDPKKVGMGGIKEKMEVKASESAKEDFCKDFDLEDMGEKCHEWQRTLARLGKEQMDKNHIATLAVTANVDALKGNETTKAFIGGVSISFKGTANQRTEILYQLIRTCYNLLREDGSKRTADAIFDQVMDQIKSGKDHFEFDPEKAMMASMEKLMEKLFAKKIGEFEENEGNDNTSD